MVQKVYGKANGTEVIFEYQGGDLWTITVPSNLEGEYVVELYAEDDAGNESYLCKMIFTIFGHELKAVYMDTSYFAENTSRDLTGIINLKEFLADIIKNDFGAEKKEKRYAAEVIKGGYTVEHTVCSRNSHGHR